MRFSRAMRGYSATEVDRFLDQVAEDIQKYCVQYADLERYAARLEDKIREHEELKETLSGTLVMAQESAKAKAEAADAEAKSIIDSAKSRAERIVQELALARAVAIPVIASGGVSRMADLTALKATGVIAGAISGRALYDGAIELRQALEVLSG